VSEDRDPDQAWFWTPEGSGMGEDRTTTERDELDGGWIAVSVDLPGCMSQGETEAEALENLADAVDGVLALPS
jgi:hypothetical protein